MSETDSSRPPESHKLNETESVGDRPIPASRSGNVFGDSPSRFGTILAIDDEPDVRRVVGLILQKAG